MEHICVEIDEIVLDTDAPIVETNDDVDVPVVE